MTNPPASRKNATKGTQPREADILISLTAVQKARLRFLASAFGVSMTEVVRLLVDEQYVKRALAGGDTLANTPELASDR